jgi:hypothetical protein
MYARIEIDRHIHTPHARAHTHTHTQTHTHTNAPRHRTLTYITHTLFLFLSRPPHSLTHTLSLSIPRSLTPPKTTGIFINSFMRYTRDYLQA